MEREERTAGRRVLVCGSGNYQDWLAIAGTLRRVHDSSPIGLIIHLAVTPAPLHSPSGGLAWQGSDQRVRRRLLIAWAGCRMTA